MRLWNATRFERPFFLQVHMRHRNKSLRSERQGRRLLKVTRNRHQLAIGEFKICRNIVLRIIEVNFFNTSNG